MNHMMENMPHTMGQAGHMMGSPVAHGAMLAATGFAAGRGLLGSVLLRNPLIVLAAGVAAGYLIHKHQKEIILALTKATGMGKDFLLHQKESLEDLIAEAKEQEAKADTTETPVQS
jgi:hypothetical protein